MAMQRTFTAQKLQSLQPARAMVKSYEGSMTFIIARTSYP